MDQQQESTQNPAATTIGDGAVHVEELRGAIMYRNSMDRLGRWKKYTRYVANNMSDPKDVGKDAPKVNLHAARARSIPPQLAFNNPTFDVTCISALPNPNSEAAAAAMLERTWRDEQIQPIFQRGLLDWPTVGRGIFFVGFESAQEGEVLDAKKAIADTQEVWDRQNGGRGIIEKARKLLGIGDKNLPVDPPNEIKTFKMMVRMRAFVERVSPFDFAVDPCASSAQDATHMSRRIHMPLSRAKLMFGAKCPTANSIGNVAVYTSESDTSPFEAQAISDAEKFPEAVRRVAVWEHWNIVARTTTYISEQGVVIGGPYQWKSAYPGFPFVILDWDEITDCPYPEGVCASLDSLVNELCEMRRRELEDLGKSFDIIVAPEDLSPENRRALENAKDRAVLYVPIEQANAINNLNRMPIPADAWTLENRIMANADEVSRTSAGMSGALNPVRRSATESSIAASGTDATMSARQLQVETASAEIAERLLAAMFATFDEPITLSIVNQDPDYIDPDTGDLVPVGTPIEYDFIATEHAAFYKVSVLSGSMASVAKDVERQQLLSLRQVLDDEPHFDKVAFDMHLMSAFPSIKDPSKFIKVPEAAPAPEEMTEDPMSGFHQMPDGSMMPDAAMQPPMGGAMLPPGGMMPMAPDLGVGSGNMQADLLAATFGAAAPMTGPNGYGPQ